MSQYFEVSKYQKSICRISLTVICLMFDVLNVIHIYSIQITTLLKKTLNFADLHYFNHFRVLIKRADNFTSY